MFQNCGSDRCWAQGFGSDCCWAQGLGFSDQVPNCTKLDHMSSSTHKMFWAQFLTLSPKPCLYPYLDPCGRWYLNFLAQRVGMAHWCGYVVGYHIQSPLKGSCHATALLAEGTPKATISREPHHPFCRMEYQSTTPTLFLLLLPSHPLLFARVWYRAIKLKKSRVQCGVN